MVRNILFNVHFDVIGVHHKFYSLSILHTLFVEKIRTVCRFQTLLCVKQVLIFFVEECV